MPRASYGDKFTVTAMKGEDKHTVFDVTSKVVDFLLIRDPNSSAPQSLLILAEEELVAVDMTDDSWSTYASPYLNSIHASAVTCLTHVADLENDLYKKLVDAKGTDSKEKVSENPWPITGGKLKNEASDENQKHELLVTGHEDGSVKIWTCDSVALSHLATIRTNKYFVGDELDEPPGTCTVFLFNICSSVQCQICLLIFRRRRGRGVASIS